MKSIPKPIFGVIPDNKTQYAIYYIPHYGWISEMLNYKIEIGPYFSLPEAIRRIEKLLEKECYWIPINL